MSEQPDHYFTARPASSDERRTLTVRLAGRDVEVETAGGVFSPGRVDLGTQVLLRTVPDLPAGASDVLDLGCGWGPVALTMALEARDTAPGARVWAVDVNERSLDLVARNAARLGVAVEARLPDDVPADVRFDTIWSNPPIRVGKEALHELLVRWLPRLRPGGDAWLVVQRNLGADSLQAWLTAWLAEHQDGATVERAASAKGFRVLRVHQR